MVCVKQSKKWIAIISLSIIAWIMIMKYLISSHNSIAIATINSSSNKQLLSADPTIELCTPTTKSSYPRNVLTPVHSGCPIKEKELRRMSIITSDSKECVKINISYKYNNITCPNNDDRTQQFLNNNVEDPQRYADRNKQGECSRELGMWWGVTLAQQKCYLLLVLKYLNITRNTHNNNPQIWLDWGAGCSHQSFWLYQYYGHYGFGLDLIEANKKFGMKEFGHDGNGPVIGYCSGDATDLGYLEAHMFDNILTVAAVYHLPNDQQCELVTLQFMRIVKKGGKIILAWQGEHDQGIMTKAEWKQCLDNYEGKYGQMEYKIVMDLENFGYTLYEHDTVFSIFITKT